MRNQIRAIENLKSKMIRSVIPTKVGICLSYRFPIETFGNDFYKSFYFLLFTFYFLLFTCLYGKGAGTTAGTILLQTQGIRQFALGGSGASVSGDIYSMYFNPAGISDISDKQISSLFATGLSNDYRVSIVCGIPFHSRKKSALAFGIFHLNGGKMEINYVDGTSKEVVSQSDYLVTLGWGGYTSKSVSVGYNIKYLSTKLVEAYDTSAIAFDTGLLIKNKNERLKIGLAAQNYGTSLKYRSKKESLPFLIRGGASYRFPLSAHHALLTVVDSFYLWKEQDIYSSAGAEYAMYKKYFLRGGCKIMPDRNSFTLGAGLKFHQRFSLDWATELSVLNNPHNISFSMKF